MRAFGALWDELCRERYGVTDPKLRQFRYGVQVNSLGLTEQQPENNAWRILIEALGVTLSKDARCRALQLPTWNEALSLPRPWDQQWSLRLQQILAYETDLLEYGDLFTGNPVIEREGRSRCATRRARARDDRRDGRHPRRDRDRLLQARARALDGGADGADRARRADRRRRQQVDRGPAVAAGRRRRRRVRRPIRTAAEQALASLAETRATPRSGARAQAALAELERLARAGEPIMEASIECALARVTTGEWAGTLRGVWGEYRAADRRRRRAASRTAATRLGGAARAGRGPRRGARAGGRACSSASPGSTATRTAPR